MDREKLARTLGQVRILLRARGCALFYRPAGEMKPILVTTDGIAPGEAESLAQRVPFLSAAPNRFGTYRTYRLDAEHDRSRWYLVVAEAYAPEMDRDMDDRLPIALGYLTAVIDNYENSLLARHSYQAIIEIGNQIQADVDLDSVLKLIVESARSLMGTELSWLGLVDEARHRLRIKVAVGNLVPAFARMSVSINTGVGGKAIELRQTIIVHDYPSFHHRTNPAARQAVLDEGVVCMICAPMLRGSKVLGALYVGNRKPTRFTESDASLLTSLATQASIAIDNAQLVSDLKKALQQATHLNSLLESKNRVLEDLEAIHRRLTDAMLAGMQVEQLGNVLADLVRRQLVIRQDICPPFTSTHIPRSARPEGEACCHSSGEGHETGELVSVPILAGQVRLGEILLTGQPKLGNLKRRALEHGATVLALELLKQREIQAVEERLRGDVLSALLEEADDPSPALSERAKRLGFDVAQPHYIVVIDREGRTADTGRRWNLLALATATDTDPTRKALAVERGDRAILAIPASHHLGPEQIARRLLARLGESAVAGVSGQTGPGRSYRTAYSEALGCLRLAHICDAFGSADNEAKKKSRVITYADLGAMRFLLDSPRLDYAVEVIDEWLGPLLRRENRCRGWLLETLRAYLEADGHYPTAARRCSIHVSTLKYRLKVIGKVLGKPLNDPEVKFGLRVACRLMDIMAVAGGLSPRLSNFMLENVP
jgi:GAF domain-containing protein/sugar diacid utilization regulator